ncbi:DNA internalization-related competence protein ComEC/Rec2 [[Clostridium] saccharogumia]|uniref:DNA internalization-related competence protein ComEC/Rec2 n=1 Tax=Thomasclavelia saccharogumia TaxID=341225 RepID=UPI001D05DFBA|nr:DNA internalization-related competence protein ComEC/Rec2 [Thomasclavelia saccharogumia]MCB6706535.1 DNA internalization-related competence protein ComEC/Rec2 [Thomasclavelia saccharogumia]
MFIRYHIVFYGISCLLLIVCLLVHPIFWVLMIGYGIFVIYRLKMINFISIFIFTIIFSFFINWPKPINDTVIKGKIVDLDEKSVVVKTDETKVKVYGNFIGYHLDDELEMEVEYFEINEPTNDNAFNYKNYLYSQGITNNASIKRLLDVNTKETLFQKLQERISSNDLIDSYASMFVLGIKDEVIEDYYQQLTDLSVVHLFALSGLHIHLLKDMLKKVLRFFMPDKYIDYFGIVLIGIYIYLIPFNISFVRAYLVMVLAVLFKRYLNKLDCLSIVTIIMLWTNPYIIFSLSFIFSYFIYFVILLINKNKYFNLLVYFGSLPIILMIQYRINILSLLLGIVLVPLVSLLYQIIWLYMIFGDVVRGLVMVIIYFLNNIITFCNDFSVFLNFSKPSLFFILVYYFIYFKIILKINIKRNVTREVLLLFSLLLMFYLKPYYCIEGKVVMIDVGQGDCFLIQQPFNQGNILIDTGGLRNKDLASLTLVPYLRSQGIFELDYVFISHDDFDHCGAYESLSNQIEIKHTVKKYQEKMKIGNIEIEMLKSDVSSNDNNDTSLVIKATINDLVYLFIGDASNLVEKDLIKKYPDLKVDVLKVSHHGSTTGTCSEFLEVVRPKIALISCGKDNRYGHPSDAVLRRLEDYDIKIYRSDLMGMVKIVYYGDDNYIYP